ncbi:oxidized low-density lipoprotein receptor 1-like [Ruditapes philippinarum]|uniref:oxidized low-density lipoprotein receptor 1-like n=1 Tax=Ruditapes philippinarum TaxID=129788 RepID=UPI00295BBDF2|nr:oxidized low-density lipoprotein receptor 1-like [Ruditapes philippinarum]
MRTVSGKFYLKFVTVALCLFSIKAERTKSRSLQNNASISKIKFWNAISSEILGLKSNIAKIWKNLDQLKRTSNDNNFCEMHQGFGEELRRKDKQKEKASYKKSGDSNICSVIRTLNTDVIQLERTFNISIKTINQDHADVKAHLNKTSLKVEELDKKFNSLDNFTKFSYKKHHDELERLNNTVAKNTDELVSIKETLEGMGENLQTVLKILNTLKECPSGWTKHDLSCYSCRTESLKWENAVNTCLEEGAHLVEFESQDEVKFVLDLFLRIAGRYNSHKWAGFFMED